MSTTKLKLAYVFNKFNILNLFESGASIIGGFAEQSLTYLKVVVDQLVILTNLLCLDRQIVA